MTGIYCVEITRRRRSTGSMVLKRRGHRLIRSRKDGNGCSTMERLQRKSRRFYLRGSIDRGQSIFSIHGAFMWMPLAALVGGAVFCMHGGIPAKLMAVGFPELENLQLTIKSPRDDEIVADLLWTDPTDEDIADFVTNRRGFGHQFGPRQVEAFCSLHKLDKIIRARQVFVDGHKFACGGRVLTVSSAPNYGGEFNNDAACVKIDANLKMTIEHSPTLQKKKPA